MIGRFLEGLIVAPVDLVFAMDNRDKQILVFVERIPGLVFYLQDLSIFSGKPLGAARSIDLGGEPRSEVPERKLGVQCALGLEAHHYVLQPQFLLNSLLTEPLDDPVPIRSLSVKVAE